MSVRLYSDERKRLAQISRVWRWRRDPVLWAHERLGLDIKTLDWTQAGLDKYRTHKWDGTRNPIRHMGKLLGESKWVGCESATAVGKTYFAAILVLWFLDCWPKTKTSTGGLVITVGPKEDQLKGNLWKEIGLLWPRFAAIRPGAKLMDLRIRMRPGKADQNAWGAIAYPIGVGKDELSATKIQGFHAEHMFFIVEETPGVPLPVIEAIKNTSVAPHNILLALGNPDSEFDTLHQFCSLASVESVRISAFDHPNYVLNDPQLIPGAVSKASVTRRLKDLGGDDSHPLYVSRVRGICPTMSDQCLFRPESIEAAKKYLKQPEEAWPMKGGRVYIYRKPLATHRGRFIIFADVAGDHADGDAHGAIVLDRLDKSVVATIQARCERTIYAKMLVRLANYYTIEYGPPSDRMINRPVLAWETQGVGALHLVPTFNQYPNLYYRRSVEQANPRPRSTLGWVTTSKTRASMIDELQEWSIELAAYPFRLRDEELLKECVTFVWQKRSNKSTEGRYEAKSGFHDDLIMALGGALVLDKMLPPYIKVRVADDDIKEQKELLLAKYRKDRLNGSDAPSFIGRDRVDPYLLPLTP